MLAADAAAGAGHDRHLALERRHCGKIVRRRWASRAGRSRPRSTWRANRPGRSRPRSGRRGRPRRSSPGRSTTSRAGPAPSRRCARTARRSSAAGCCRGCCAATASATSPSRCSARTSPAPFLLAPVGVLSIAHADGELAVARASAATGVPLILSSAASHSIEEVAEAMGDAPRWFQLYWVNDREVAASLVARAEAAGFGAIVVTARHADARLARARPAPARTCRSSPARAARSSSPTPSSAAAWSARPRRTCSRAAAAMLATFPNLDLTWDDLDWLRAPDRAAAAREGRARGRGRRRSRSSTAPTGSSSRTTAAARWTARSPRSTRSWRCGPRSAPTPSC